MSNKLKVSLRIIFVVVASLFLLTVGRELWSNYQAVTLTENVATYTRTSIPHGSLLVLAIPVVATGTLFFGLTHVKK